MTHILSHLPASSLAAVSLVSRYFYSLVTTPHAWRVAFSRYFPGQDALDEFGQVQHNRRLSDAEARESLKSEQRFFVRLTGLASWRSEYILRTRLLRSLARGKPSQIEAGHGASSKANSIANNANPVVTYNSQLFTTINHLHAVFSNEKKAPQFIHGANEMGAACTSDPNIGKVDNWGLSDPQPLAHFVDLFPGDAMYGLSNGQLVGVPNAMDVSQSYGMIYGEGLPGGQVYFRSSEEMRGRFLTPSTYPSTPELGIPKIDGRAEAKCAVWIAKSKTVPEITDGLVGMLVGSSAGTITAYSLGTDNLRDVRLNKGEITARWVLSPGVPIIAISIDESYSVRRKSASRVWAVALNALGEAFYLTNTPRRPPPTCPHLDEIGLERLAWETGRSVYWQLVEPTRRVSRDDPYRKAEFDGSYSPRSSADDMHLSKDQLKSETYETETFLRYQPVHFQKVCEGWDMRRKLEVDFAGDDGHGAGEGIIVTRCGVDGHAPEIRRFSRWRSEQASLENYPHPKTPPMASKAPTMASLFGGKVTELVETASHLSCSIMPTPPSARKIGSAVFFEEWRVSSLSLKGQPQMEITTTALDMSIFALTTVTEDPLLTVSSKSAFSSPASTPVGDGASDTQVPGYRGRFFAVGTKSGDVILWNIRGPQSSNPAIVNELHPLRTIHTDSPQISCLAVSALFIVHGGNDGLVQTWDPLASTMQPIRTLHSRFSSRARRRLVQAEASQQGVGINLYAAGAIILDPDPTVLRGMVSLGTHLRYWSYSSSAADQYSSKKRRLRRSSERGHNGTPDRFTNTGRGALMDYIATEQEELKRDKEHRQKEEALLAGRFGVGLAGLTEEEALKYAEMVSQEAYLRDQERQLIENGSVGDADSSSAQSAWSVGTVTPEGSVTGTGTSATPRLKSDSELDQDIEEAIRLSLMEGVNGISSSPRGGSATYDIPIIYKEKKSKAKRSVSASPSFGAQHSKGKDSEVGADDLDFALQLSLAEERSRLESGGNGGGDEYPALNGFGTGKGKGRA